MVPSRGKNKVEIKIVCHAHCSGQRRGAAGGVAAILAPILAPIRAGAPGPSITQPWG